MVHVPRTHRATEPIRYDLSRDYAQFGLEPWQANEIIGSCFFNRNGGRGDFLVFHIQDGITTGSLDWWSSSAVQASSTVMAQLDGSLLYIVPRQHGPWTNGDVNNPTAEAKELMQRGGNANTWSLTCEAEGRGPVSDVGDAQLNAMLWWAEDEIMRNPLILESTWCLLAHRFINSVTRANCGLYLHEIVTGINIWLDDAVIEPPPPEPEPEPPASPYPPGMTEPLAKRLYGELQVPWSSKVFHFDLARSECRWWLARGKAQLEEGEDYTKATWPKIEDVIRRGDGKTRTFTWEGGVVWEQVTKGI